MSDETRRPSISPEPNTISVVRTRPGRASTGLAQCHLVALGSLQRAKRSVADLRRALPPEHERSLRLVDRTVQALDRVEDDPVRALQNLEDGATRLDELRNHLVVELSMFDEAHRLEEALDELHAACDGLARALRRSAERAKGAGEGAASG